MRAAAKMAQLTFVTGNKKKLEVRARVARGQPPRWSRGRRGDLSSLLRTAAHLVSRACAAAPRQLPPLALAGGRRHPGRQVPLPVCVRQAGPAGAAGRAGGGALVVATAGCCWISVSALLPVALEETVTPHFALSRSPHPARRRYPRRSAASPPRSSAGPCWWRTHRCASTRSTGCRVRRASTAALCCEAGGGGRGRCRQRLRRQTGARTHSAHPFISPPAPS
jgi:hypothetical protein